MITATAYAAATLNAPVEILNDLNGGGRVRVRTLAGGVGGWSEPGRELFVDPAILSDITDTDGASVVPAEPALVVPVAPLTEPIDAADYMDVLLARRAAWKAEWEANRPGLRLRMGPTLEWFIEPGDEQWVRGPVATSAPKRQPTPRVYRSAESIRAELADVEAQMARVAGEDCEDGAVVNLSPYSRSRAARNAGRRRFAKLDRDLERYAKLQAKRARLSGQLARAEAREANAATIELPESA